MSRIRVLIADDHAVVREGLVAVLSHEPDLLVVAQASDGEQAVMEAIRQSVDVVVLDLRMPNAGGMPAIAEFRARAPTTRVLVLSTYDDERYVRAAFAAGAHGYVVKRSSTAQLLAAIRAVRNGERYVDPEITHLTEATNVKTESDLSERELEVLQLVVEGHTHKEIARRLGISKSSIDTYRARIMQKLQVESRIELIAKARALESRTAR